MKCIMVMFDSLNRRMLPPYGCDWTVMPNFARLAERTVTFENSYVGSMPCMPARRELHTGRYNFLHRGWGPHEPFDDSMPAILKQNGVYAHLASDHYHYWEDGGCTYHTKYNSWQFSRGQEGDSWIGEVKDPDVPECVNNRGGDPTQPMKKADNSWRQDWINRKHMQAIEDQPQPKTFAMGLEFIERNHTEDNWFLHIETFDPHEPYFSDQKYKDLYPHDYDGKHFDWPSYSHVTEDPAEVEHCRRESAALHSMCDEYLGRVLDAMDRHDLWKDTMLIVNTDHGFLMAEHDLWAKCHCPFYNEVAHTPLFIWDPRSGVKGVHRESLVQTIDLPATVLEYFGLDLPADMQGSPLRQTVADDTPVREAGLFGLFGAQVNVTDGRYVYMRAPQGPENAPLFEYTHMPTRMRGYMPVETLRSMTASEPLPFTKGCPVMKIDANAGGGRGRIRASTGADRTMLFDLQADPGQQNPIEDPDVEQRMAAHMVRLMQWNDAPPEQYERLGLAGHL